jgi:glutathione S-transferase
MMELAKAAYLDEVLFSTTKAKERFEILSFIELALRLDSDAMCAHLNTHLSTRMFLVGGNITAADIVVFLTIACSFSELMDFQKIALANTFRWLDHIQHLPGMHEQAEALGVLTAFPDLTQTEPTKSQLKKLEKIQAAKLKKEAKQAGQQPAKGGDQKKEKPQ